MSSTLDRVASAGPEAASEITIRVNAESKSICAATLADVLVALGYGGQKVATAVNGDFVPERMRVETAISDGDNVEVLSARQGG